MKSIIVALLLTIPFSAKAASPLENYLAARDGHIAKFTAVEDSGKFTDRTWRDVQRALQDLEKQLRGIIGPTVIKGFSTIGKINIDTLVRSDVGFGKLDALIYTSQSGAKDNKSLAYVTTSALFDQWLKDNLDKWALTKSAVPKDAGAALTMDTFYTFAISADAAVDKYAELPVARPANARSVFAMLAAVSQDDSPTTPKDLIVSVLHETRVFVATAPVATKIAPIPACQEIWKGAEEKEEAAHKIYRDSNLQDEAALARAEQLREEGLSAFHRCYAERAKDQPFFGALVRQAQGLLERLPVK